MKKFKLLFTIIGICRCVFADTLPTMNAATLKKYNGQNGNPSYVALNGKVYDVSNVDEWHDGKHYKGMAAGIDLTPNISKSPHGASIVDSEGLKPIATYSK